METRLDDQGLALLAASLSAVRTATASGSGTIIATLFGSSFYVVYLAMPFGRAREDAPGADAHEALRRPFMQ
jgi:hypothetical protein